MQPFQKKPYIFSTCLLLLAGLVLIGCSDGKKEKHYRIGFSQCTGAGNWRQSMLQAVEREISFHPGTELHYKDAKDNSELQIQQIRELVKEGIDILIVCPNEPQPLTPIVEEVYSSGIPVILIDRKIASSFYTSYVGADNYELGKLGAACISKLLNGKGNVVEIIGLASTTPAIERQRGFNDALRLSPGIKIISEVYGNWQKEITIPQLEKNLDKLSQADVIFAQNDHMALAAYDVYQKAHLTNPIKLIGVDGLPGPGEGIDGVSNKVLDATLLYPTGGQEAVQTAIKILDKEAFQKENTLQTFIIDSTNVRLMKSQTDKINSQQKDIERQNEILNQQVTVYKNQKTMLQASIGALCIIILLAAAIFHSLRVNKKIVRRLAAQNEEIQLQKNQLIEMAVVAKEANEAKLNFFTGISHEFRTPLSLILAPLESTLRNPKLPLPIKQNLDLINKNVLRLLRLINQLMDFRKMEHGKMKIRATENNLSNFVMDITNAFRDLSQKKALSLNLLLVEKDLKVWFDPQMLDKVIFNLLSNAYKFTNEQGYINILVTKSEDGQKAVIRIEDSGVGMTPEAAKHAFDLFYQGSDSSYKGSGVGLALSKQLITLHHGTISLKSEKWKGSSFEIQLPLGNSHLSKDEMVDALEGEASNHDDLKLYTADAEPIAWDSDMHTGNPSEISAKEYSVLLIEDHHDMRTFLRNSLQQMYEIHEAENGTSGLNMAYDLVPDLIICDIMLPGHNGLHITETLKNDIRTSHIPIIILTAKMGMENQIESLRLKADSYITKPFNLQHLEETIKSLLKNRESLKEHYTCELPSEIRTGTSKKIDRKFINEFAAIVESNIANENFSVDTICQEIGISRVQLYRKLKALLGMNFNDYLLNARLQKAKYFLAKEPLTIAEVAFKVGFSSQAYFSTVFKANISCTPTEYKEKFKNVNQKAEM